jgi:hypothetical protein
MIDALALVPAPGASQTVYDGEDASYRDSNGGLVKQAETTLVVAIAGAALAAYADATVDGSAADTGILVTAAPAANEHGLPANFGPGRGNWQIQDAHRISTDVLETGMAAPVAGGQVVELDIQISGGDMRLAYKNLSTIALTGFAVRIRFDNAIAY